MKKVYLDNAATTAISKGVATLMQKVIEQDYGNPSSPHFLGRAAKVMIEDARKKVAKLINASPSEIFFTSGGTEANNTIINGVLNYLEVNLIISSKLEHPAVLKTCIESSKNKNIKVVYVKNCSDGHINIAHLKELIESNKDKKILVSLMHANNEIGAITPIDEIGTICKEKDVLFHSDTVQTMTHQNFNLEKLNIDFLTCSAHKFHGPKGIGFLYINKKNKLAPLIYGGSQERNLRGGTENVYGIVGLAEAMEIGCSKLEQHESHIKEIKYYMMEKLETFFLSKQLEVFYNGNPKKESLNTVLNVSFPKTKVSDMFLYYLDMKGICASEGSACSSGSNKRSHVLEAINADKNRPSIRFSFSRLTTKEDIDYTVKCIEEIYQLSES